MDRTKRISTVTLWGASANLLLCVFKMVAGILGASAAMVADAVHSLSDLVSDAVVLVMVRISSRKTDRNHGYGHRKFETLATMAVSLILLLVGARLLAGSAIKIKDALEGRSPEAPGMISLWAALLSIAVKEILYQWNSREGRKLDSPAMIANAWHHRSDALSSVGSALGIGGAILLGGGWTVLDPVAGCIISIVIMVVAVKMAIPALNELTDASLPEEMERNIVRIMESVPGAGCAHELKTRRSGPNIIIDAHIVVDPDMNVREAHKITSEIERALCSEFGQGTQINIHIEPGLDAD